MSFQFFFLYFWLLVFCGFFIALLYFWVKSPWRVFKLFFKPAGVFKITVPADYEYRTSLDSVNKKKFNNFNVMITDKNFNDERHQLQPGKTYLVKKYNIKDLVTCQIAIKMMEYEEALFLKPQALAFLWSNYPEIFDSGKTVVCLERRHDCYMDQKDTRPLCPGIARTYSDIWDFHMLLFDAGLDPSDELLCFFEIKS